MRQCNKEGGGGRRAAFLWDMIFVFVNSDSIKSNYTAGYLGAERKLN